MEERGFVYHVKLDEASQSSRGQPADCNERIFVKVYIVRLYRTCIARYREEIRIGRR